MLYYAGIGSRETPENVLKVMVKIATFLESKNYTLRSGGAVGADNAFYSGTIFNHVYLVNYQNEILLSKDNGKNIITMSNTVKEFANAHVAVFHPNYVNICNQPKIKLLHARNTLQITGHDLRNIVLSRFVICWTKTGNTTTTNKDDGGTGQAIRIANFYKIPVYNLKNENVDEDGFVKNFINGILTKNNTLDMFNIN